MVRDIPLSVLFTWPQPNYVDPVTRGPALIIINAVFISLCTLLLFLRLYTRIFVKRWFGSDDVFIILAYLSTVGLTINVIIANKHFYWDRHIWDVPITAFTGVLKVAFSAKLIFVYAATFTRQSLLCFYYRLVADSGIRWFGWALHATIFLNIAAAIAFTCLGIWQCNPISAYWTLSPPAGAYCTDEGKTVLGIGIVNCFMDLVVTMLPIPLVKKLQMRLQQRIGVMILLSLGFVVVIAGVVRTYYIWKGLIASYDETWFTFPLWIAAAVEINLGVICACMPALRPFIKRCVAPAFSNVSSRISSLISRSSASGSTLQSSRYSRGNGSYQKFGSKGKDANNQASNSTGDDSTLKETGGKLPSRRNTKHAHLADHTTVDNEHDNDDNEASFFTRQAARLGRHRHRIDDEEEGSTNGDERATSYNTTPHLPFVRSHSPLQITRRRSYELVSLDRCRVSAATSDHDISALSQQQQDPQHEHLDLDPRERGDGAAFGHQWEVSCPDDGEKDGEGKVGGKKLRGILGMGWGRYRE